MRSVELFSGCGGLALGTARAGFHHDFMVEWNEKACSTLAINSTNSVKHAKDWRFYQGDVRDIDWSMIALPVDLVAGGPPCQPFSIGGKHKGNGDVRDMWPEAIRAVRELRPRGFLFENVRGLARAAFSDYLGWIKKSLESPNGDRREYDVVVLRLNAADYGAAQKRHRVVVAGVKADLGVKIVGPNQSHSHQRLLWDQWISGEYWDRHGIPAPSEPASEADRRVVARLRSSFIAPSEKPWRTVRDAIAGLGNPNGVSGHEFQDGARIYKGHTGSPLDEPAKALKAGDHGVPGGENMMVKDDGSVRYFTIREAARLQGLPDEWQLAGAWTEAMRQLGNAVPVELAEAIGRWMAEMLDRESISRKAA